MIRLALTALFFALAANTAWAQDEAPPAPPSAILQASPGLEQLFEGDRLWFGGDRGAAVAAYRRAARSGEPAAETMARLRLLWFSGNLGMVRHGPRLDRALDACGSAAWCDIAEADFHLFAPAEVGARRDAVAPLAARAAAELPGPALARRILAAGPGQDCQRLAELPRDGLGDGLLANAGQPPAWPGTWVLGLGLVGAPGLGFGGALHFVHPDLAWGGHYLALEAGGTSRGSGWLSAAGASAGRLHGVGSMAVSRWVLDVYEGDQVSSWLLEGLRVSAGPGLRLGKQRLRLGGSLRQDRADGDNASGHGAWASWILDRRRGWGGGRRGGSLGLDLDSAILTLGADYPHLSVGLDLRGFLGGPWGTVLAGRLLGERAFFEDAPFYRLPSAGGAEILRGAPAGRYRGATLAAADLELRRMVVGPLEAVVFGAAAWVQDEGLHPGGGGGIRVLLPPRHLNAVRLDVAVSDAGWGLTTGWGEAF